MCDGKRTNITGTNNKLEYEGKTFGKLTVIQYINAREVICRCNCENKTIIKTRKYRLDNGTIQDCGCSSEHTLNKIKYEKIKNKEYIVLEYKNAANIFCRCSCGNTFITTKTHIDKNIIHSCGCRHHMINNNKKYELDAKGYLTIGKHIGYGIYECRCVCGTICYRSKQQLDSSNNPSCGCKMHALRGRTEDNLRMLERIYNYIISNKGKTIKEISERLNLSYSTIQKAVHTLNIEDNVVFNDNTSSYEKEIREFIDSFGVKAIYNSRKIIEPLELDIYIPDKKLAIEFNGNYWHSDVYVTKDYHRDKTLNCTKQGIRLIHIFEYEWVDEIKKEIIKNIITGLITDNKNTIFARNTVVKEIDTELYKDFCNKNHLQGYANASIKLGCFYNEELIGIMSFSNDRFNSAYEYELIRLCWKSNTNVIGGSEKLFNYFLENYNPKSIITYCNISKFTGNVYSRLGFKIIEITEPNYVWTKFQKTLTRYQTQKHKLVEQGLGIINETEEEIMKKNKYMRVYDSGNLKFLWLKEV